MFYHLGIALKSLLKSLEFWVLFPLALFGNGTDEHYDVIHGQRQPTLSAKVQPKKVNDVNDCSVSFKAKVNSENSLSWKIVG